MTDNADRTCIINENHYHFCKGGGPIPRPEDPFTPIGSPRPCPRGVPGDMIMRELLISTVATGVLLLGLMGAHTAITPTGASSALSRTPSALHAGSNVAPVAYPAAGTEIAS